MESFNEKNRSCLEKLYPRLEDIAACNPRLDDVDAKRLFAELVAAQPFFAKRAKSAGVRVDKLDLAVVPRLYKAMDGMRRGSYSAYVEFVRVREFPGVKLFHAETKNGRPMPPRMSIELDPSVHDTAPGDAVRVNTGYIVNLPRIAYERRVENGKVVTSSRPTKQQDFVVVPIVMSNADCKIVPCVTARDPDDTGLFTVNVTVVSGKLRSLRVLFNAYLVEQSTDFVELTEPEPNVEVFKMKDTWEGRLVKNLKVKTHFDSGRVDEAARSVTFATYNSIVSPPVTYARQRLTIRGQTALFVSRKREWCNPDVATMAGLFDGEDPSRSVLPQIVKLGQAAPPKNTHCLVFVSAKATLYSDNGKPSTLFKILNGAFNDHPAYPDLSKNVRQFIAGVRGLCTGYDAARQLAKRNPELDLGKLMRLYDYHRCLVDSGAELKQKSEMTDEEMHRSKPAARSPYSVHVLRSLETLYAHTLGEAREDDEERSEESIQEPRLLNEEQTAVSNGDGSVASSTVAETSATTTTRKRSNGDATTDDAGSAAASSSPQKRMKL